MHALRVGCGSSHSLSVHVVIVIAIVIIILIVFIRRRNKLLFLGRGWLYACMLPTYLDYVRKVYQRRAVGVVTFHHSLQEVYVVVFGLAPENLVHQRLRFHVKKKKSIRVQFYARMFFLLLLLLSSSSFHLTSHANRSAGLPFSTTVSRNPIISFTRPDTRTIPYTPCARPIKQFQSKFIVKQAALLFPRTSPTAATVAS